MTWPSLELRVHITDLFLTRLALAPAVLVSIESTQGSVPRGAGTWMAVFADGLVGSIGGGHLEFKSEALGRDWLQAQQRGETPPPLPERERMALGPSLGQCCGGVVQLHFEAVTSADAPLLRRRLMPHLRPVALFGGGHVGHALAHVLAPLPFALTWIDSRDGIFPETAPGYARCEHSDPVQAAVPALEPGTKVLIMSFSHAEDLDIVAACLLRQRSRGDLPFIGLIGSKTKWATFRNRLAQRGFTADEMAQITCPIGVPGIAGKEPEVIAVAVAAQLLLDRN